MELMLHKVDTGQFDNLGRPITVVHKVCCKLPKGHEGTHKSRYDLAAEAEKEKAWMPMTPPTGGVD